MEQATAFPRIPSPPPESRDSDTPPSSSGATSPIDEDDYLRQPLLSTNSDYSPSKTSTNPPPGFMAGSSSSSGSTGTTSARNLVHPGSNIFGFEGITLNQRNVSNYNSNMNSCGEDDNISGASSTPSSSSTSGSLAGASSSTDIATSINTSTPSGFQVVTTNSGLTSTSSSSSHHPSAFQALTEFSALSQHGITGYPLLLNNYGTGIPLQNSENYEKYLKAKQRKTNRARKNETKNVVVQCKAEDVEGYEGEKTIDDLLESLGEATPQEDKKPKQKRTSKDKRDKKRRAGDKTANTSAAGDHKDEDEEAADEEDNVDEEDEITRIRETKGKKKKGGGSKAVPENSGIEFPNQNNVYMVSVDDNLSRSENLAASSDSLNFVPVTGKKKGKKLREEQEKMRDYPKKGKEDLGRGVPGVPAPGPGRDARISQTRDAQLVLDNRRTSNYSLRSREVQISPEPEKEVGNHVSVNHEPEQFPAFDAIQDFPALPSVSMTDKQHNNIHSAWVRKPSSGSCSSTTPPTNNNNNTSAVTTTTSAHNNHEQKQQPCDKLSVNQSNTKNTTPQLPAVVNAANTNTDDVFKAAVKDSSSIDAAKNIKRSQESDPSPNSGNSNNNNNSEITCDKSIVSDELSTATPAGDKDTNNHNNINEQRGSIVASDICFVESVVPPSSVGIPAIAQSAATSTNPLLNDDNIEATGLIAANIQGIVVAAGQCNNNKDNVTGDITATRRSGEAANIDDDGPKLGEFHFDTRADAVLGGGSGSEAAISFTQEEEGEISFGFDINYQLIDDSLNPEQMIQPIPDEVHEGGVDDHQGQGGAVVNAADGLDSTNIASVDKAIVSFSTAEGVLVGGGYHFMNNIHPQFASNDMPLRSQVDVSGTPCADPREGEPKEVEVVSPESGICSPLSWQGEGEEAGNTTTSPPIQPGSYPRRPAQENRDLICELKKLKYRGSSRSPSPHHSVRSGSAGSFTHGASDISYTHGGGDISYTHGADDLSYTHGGGDISYTHGAADISYTHGAGDVSFPRSEDSGLNTTRNQMEQLISAPSPNHTEIVSFLQNNWEEFSKDKKKVKVYGEKKEQRR